MSVSTPPMAELSGPIFIGYSFHYVAYGALCIQLYLYYLSFPKDSRLAKGLVAFLCAAGTFQTALIIHDSFVTFVTDFEDPNPAFMDDHLSWLSVPLLTGLIGAGTQLFYLYRIWLLCHSFVLVSATMICAFLQGGAAIAAGAISRTASFVELINLIKVPTSIWLIGSATCDVMIAITMVFYFMQKKNKMDLHNAVYAVVVGLLMETGFVTAVVAIVDVVLFLAFPGKVYHIGAAPSLAMLYCNSCMAILNSRINIVGSREESSFSATAVTSTLVARHNNTGLTRRFVDTIPAVSNPPTVKVQQDIWSEGIPLESIEQTASVDTHEFTAAA